MAKRQGRPTKIRGEHKTILVQIVESDPTATLDEIGAEPTRRTGLKASRPTLVSTLRRHGIERVASHEAVVVETAAPGSARYGYADAHRREAVEQMYPSCLTNAEWALGRDLFEKESGRVCHRASVVAP